jgi:hypothetical protein
MPNPKVGVRRRDLLTMNPAASIHTALHERLVRLSRKSLRMKCFTQRHVTEPVKPDLAALALRHIFEMKNKPSRKNTHTF